jgi:hypothetical protein
MFIFIRFCKSSSSSYINSYSKKAICARCLWLTPVIIAIQEAEIRRRMAPSQPRQTVQETLSQETHHKKELVE